MIKEAAMQPVRELSPDELLNIKDSSAMRKVKDWNHLLSKMKPKTRSSYNTHIKEFMKKHKF